MTAQTTPDSPSKPRDVATTSYWTVVRRQFSKNRVAVLASYLLVSLVGAAIYAPVLAFNVPLVYFGTGGPSVPLFQALFDRFLFPNGVDVFFNLALVALPLWLTVVRARAATGRPRARKAWIAYASLHFLVMAVAVARGRTSILVAFAGVAVPGALLLGARVNAARDSLLVRRGRLAALLLFVFGFSAIQLLPRETSPWKDWRAEAAAGAGVAAVFPPIPFHPDNVGDKDPYERGQHNEPSASNWLGCDPNGRDVLARLLFGTRISLTIGLVGVSIYVLIGVLLGSLAGFFGGWVDLLISRVIEIMICFPTLFLILTVIAVFETRSIFLIMAVIGFVGWPGVARLVRGEFLRQRGLDYVTAATAMGFGKRRIIFRHVLPNCLGPVLVSATFGVAGAILTESGLAFLGLGDTTAASWGQMLTTGRSSLQWHLILAPGFAIFFVVTVFNLLGEGLRDALDPKLRR